MTPRTKAEVFIQTLEEMCDHDRELRKARLRLQLKAHVKRFVEEFRSDFAGTRHVSEWTPQGGQRAHEVGRRFRHE